MLDIGYRYYKQTQADFYQDLFPFADSQNFLARDKEMSAFNSHSVRFGVSWNLVDDGWSFLERASLNFTYDYIFLDYQNFRDLRFKDDTGAPLYAPGEEPLFSFGANVFQIFFSVWF